MAPPTTPDPFASGLTQSDAPDRADQDPLPSPYADPGEWLGSGVTRSFMLPGRDSAGPLPRPPPPAAAAGDSRQAGAFATPTAVGRYLLGGEIGRGGVGVVHEGWDAQLEREIAIKMLLEEHRGNPVVIRRFLAEARITSRLQHPGVVAVHDLGLSPDGRPFFVMRFVRGETLDRILLRREDVSAGLPQLLDVFLQLSQAVAYAHSQGVIHRDLKPSNVMVGAFGVVKVMDWGLAKVLGEPEVSDALAAVRESVGLPKGAGPGDDSDPALPETLIGTVFGTPAYLPPEQARGEIDRVDKRADVFGLGGILCETLTGHPPYTGATGREIYRKAAAANLAEAVSRVNACPAALDLLTLTKWCLSPAPDDRPADAAGVVEVMIAYVHADQRRAELDLVRFFDLSADLFCIASTDGYFLRVNENFPRVLGYTAAELLTRPFADFVHPDDRDRTEVETARISDGPPCVRFTNRYRHADGHYVWLEWNAQVVLEERAVYAVARDVSERAAARPTANGQEPAWGPY